VNFNYGYVRGIQPARVQPMIALGQKANRLLSNEARLNIDRMLAMVHAYERVVATIPQVPSDLDLSRLEELLVELQVIYY
jgi:hypothetical protein